jgi:tRNA (adenine57-N1/adenine58-N1)-methyltransferase
VCQDGFDLDNIADAVFLDLPAPWEAIPSAKTALKKHQISRIACFSPCIEQVSRTCDKLRDQGFSQIEMVECLIRDTDVRKVTVRTAQSSRMKGSRKLGPADEDSELAKLMISSRPVNEARGHTSFLTFACLLPEGGV